MRAAAQTSPAHPFAAPHCPPAAMSWLFASFEKATFKAACKLSIKRMEIVSGTILGNSLRGRGRFWGACACFCHPFVAPVIRRRRARLLLP